jgi:diguanylate cyclase (GGDEF)-like protein
MGDISHQLGDARRRQATHMAMLFGAAALVTLIGLLAPHQPQAEDAGLAAISAAAAAVAAIVFVAGTRLPPIAFQLALAVGTVLISLAVVFNGERAGGAAGGDEVYYLWVVLYAAYYFGRAAVAAQVAWIAIAYAATLAVVDPGPIAGSRWLTLVGLVIGAATLVRLLTERNRALIGELSRAARSDQLTGLANRRAFEEHFGRELARARRSGEPLTLLMGDLDNFKQVNDQWGHAVGDELLADVAQVFREGLRATDVPARLGGDEFAILLPGTDTEQADEIARRLAAEVQAMPKHAASAVGLSYGVAKLPPDGSTLDDFLRVADMGLYAAKRRVRDGDDNSPPIAGRPLSQPAAGVPSTADGS